MEGSVERPNNSPLPELDAKTTVAAMPAGWRLEHTYAALPDLLHRRWRLDPVREPRLLILNRRLAAELGLDPDLLEHSAAAAVFAGNEAPPGALPLAQAYAGHQFGNFTGLGDGRALLLGEQITPDGRRFDIQLKGSGRTPFSRGGDGRAGLGPMLREYVISEAMNTLGIPTTRSLAVATTGEVILRQNGRQPGAVLTRVAASHIRVGTFEWAAAHGDRGALEALTAYTLQRHYPDCAEASNPALALLEGVVEQQASLIARWMNVGFIHGVMNTDNMALSGETIDYGPCAFLDAFDSATVFSSIDHAGRYAFGNQPAVAQWNLARLAEALLPLIHPEEPAAIEQATAALDRFSDRYKQHWLAGLRSKLGLFTSEDGDIDLGQRLFDWMGATRSDFTNTFRALTRDEGLRAPCFDDPEFQTWHQHWTARLDRQPQSRTEALDLMRASNPVVIPRNHAVEAALSAAVKEEDFAPLHRLLAVLAKPFDHDAPPPAPFTEPAPPDAPPYQTFCGT